MLWWSKKCSSCSYYNNYTAFPEWAKRRVKSYLQYQLVSHGYQTFMLSVLPTVAGVLNAIDVRVECDEDGNIKVE